MPEVRDTPAVVADTVRSILNLSSKVELSADERAFVNEQAELISDQVMRAWATGRYKARKKLRPCCVPLAVALAMDVAHRMSLPGDTERK